MTAEDAAVASPFWRFSLAVYADPEVAKVCLELQDEAGADVNVLLYMLWAASRGRRLSADDVRPIVAAVEDWRKGVVVPLRTARRSLRAPPAAVDAAGSAALRSQVKKVELEAERLQQEALYRLRPVDDLGRAEPSPEAAAAANVAAYGEVIGRKFSGHAMEVLLGALKRQQARGGSK
ncbi:MAG TPA: TIGR02444 family protein [Hyphomicrobiaceae bacterium]|nr:TIGR02444 family protein [Hyphomicrobiaceae bacterium]